MRYAGYLIIFLIAVVTQAKAQRIDSAYFKTLTQKVKDQRTDTGRIGALQELAGYYNNKFSIDEDKGNLSKSLSTLEKSIKIAIRIKNDDYRFESIRLMANAHLAMGDSVNAIKYITQAVKYFETKHDFKKVVFCYSKFARTAYSTFFFRICVRYYEKAIEVGDQHKSTGSTLPLKATLILARHNLGQTDQVNKDIADVFAQYKSKHESLASIYFFLSFKNRYKGDLKTALSYALQSLNEIEMYKDTGNASNAYGELALVYDALGKTQESITYYKKVLVVRNKMLVPEIYRYRTLGFIVKGLIKLGRPAQALKETLSYEREYPPLTTDGRAYCAQNKAYCYEALNDYPRAGKYFEQMVAVLGSKGKVEITSLAYYDISKFYFKAGKYPQAQEYASKLLLPTSFENYKNLEYLHFQIDSAMGNYRSALTHSWNYQRAKDSLFSESKSKEISELQMKYETAQKESDIALLKKDTQLQRDQLKQSDHIRNITLVGVLLLLATIALLYNSYRINIRKSREIDEKNLSLSGLIEEKEWLMKEIHHRVKNNLQIVMGLLQRQSSYIDNSAALKAIRNSEHRIHAIALIHQKLYQSDDLTLINMQEYIEELLGHLKETAGAENSIIFNKEIDEIYLHVAQAVPLGLIINEAITNAIKYAYPNTRQGVIRVNFKSTNNDQLTLIIEDEGVGISNSTDSKSMGMNLMRGLTKQLSGKFEIAQINGVSIQISFKSNHSEP